MSNEEKPQQEGMLQIEISPEVAQGTYANLAMIAHSTSEVIIDFVCMMPGLPKANVKSRIVMAPEHAKRLLLTTDLKVYEISARVGYADTTSFVKLFKREVGISPARYRRME